MANIKKIKVVGKAKKKTSWAKTRNKKRNTFAKLSKKAKRGAFTAMASKGKLYKRTKSGTRKASLGRTRKKR